MTNNTPITDAALAELKRLHAAATPGEWRRGGVLYTSRDNACSIVALHNAFFSVIARLEAAEREREDLRKENDFMRLRLAESDKACVYCSLPKAEMGACASGFPGCARADDLFHCDELTRRDAQQRREGAAQGIDQAREMLSMAESGEEADEMMRQSVKRLRERGE